jgi:hypothetical protein
MLQLCDGPACRLRARDLGVDDGDKVGCLGRCDAPVAATAAGRALTLWRRGGAPEPLAAPGAQRGPDEPVLLRDLFWPDQAQLAAARRRGAWRALAAAASGGARALASLLAAPAVAPCVLVDAAPTTPGDFGARPLCERDPHLVLEGACLAACAVGAARAIVRVRAGWDDATAALATAAAAARAAALDGGVAIDVGGALAAPDGAWRIAVADAARLARATAIATRDGDGAPDDDGVARGRAWWSAHATRLCALSGDVHRPGVYELPAAATVADALAAAGGVVDGARVAAFGAALADGAVVTDVAGAAPAALVVLNARRDRSALLC